jgi:ribosomal protein S18 acetylase RimI-like enzyme
MATTRDASVSLAMPATLAALGFRLRPETEADVPFLRRLYVSTRWEELAPIVDWSEAQKLAFLESQFGLQRRHYLTHFPAAEFSVLEQNDMPAGRIYIDRNASAVHVIDISLLPDCRRRGTGTALMQAVCAEARIAGKRATVAVEKFNPAQRLYRRLGFREIADTGAYWTMEWRATPGECEPMVS